MKVAAAWSVNPDELGPTTPCTGSGILATAPVRRQMRRDPAAVPDRRPWWRFW